MVEARQQNRRWSLLPTVCYLGIVVLRHRLPGETCRQNPDCDNHFGPWLNRNVRHRPQASYVLAPHI